MKAVVVGTGWAGEGHTRALRYAGAEVAAIVGRTAEMVEKVAARLGTQGFLSLEECIEKVRPDIVAVAVPAQVHQQFVNTALEHGCHVICEKPLGLDAQQAHQMCHRADTLGRKHAYAATGRYAAPIRTAKQLISAGEIGDVTEMEFISHYGLSPNMTFSWWHQLSQGGGRLNNNFSHKLSIATYLTGGTVLAASGETRTDIKQAPVGPRIHDFREYFLPNSPAVLSQEALEKAEWRSVDADLTYTIMTRMGAPFSRIEEGISALFKHSANRRSYAADHIAIHGLKGSLFIDGAYGQGTLRLNKGTGWTNVESSAQMQDALPDLADVADQNWAMFAREFARDIKGEGGDYPTFKDGLLCQQIVEIVRRSPAQTLMPLS